jgi:uncharacterized protein
MHMCADITVFGEPGSGEASAPAAERLLEGSPQHLVQNLYADPTQQFFAGRWSSTRGKWQVHYTEHEFCHITAGRVRIVSEAGVARTFGPGDSFVIPAGFAGSWEVLEDCAKLYAMFQPAS